MRSTGLTVLLGTTMLAQDRPATNAVVRSGVPIVLEVPTGDTTPQVIQRVLNAVGVQYGIEHALGVADGPPVDFAHRPERTVRLDGMRRGDALDAIVREDPRYDWTEANGRIVVRAATERGISADRVDCAMRESDEKVCCSFCNKSQDDVRKLIAGPTAFICDECVEVCVDIIADDRRFSESAPDSDETKPPPATPAALARNAAACHLCGTPASLEKMLWIEKRGFLCGACADAVEDALARGTPTS